MREALKPDEWVAKMLALAASADDDRVKLAALIALGDRGWGKPVETVEHDPAMTPEEYEAELDAIARERVAAMSPEERMKLLADPAPTHTIQ